MPVSMDNRPFTPAPSLTTAPGGPWVLQVKHRFGAQGHGHVIVSCSLSGRARVRLVLLALGRPPLPAGDPCPASSLGHAESTLSMCPSPSCPHKEDPSSGGGGCSLGKGNELLSPRAGRRVTPWLPAFTSSALGLLGSFSFDCL